MRLVTFLLLLAFLLFLVGCAAALYWAYQLTGGRTEEFAKVAGALLAALGALLAAAAGYLNVLRQAHTSEAVERLKAELLERMAAMERRSTAQYRAFDELTAAMNAYYRALDGLEEGQFDKEKVDGAEGRMEAAEHLQYQLHPGCRQAFSKYWQLCRVLKESAEEVGPTGDQAKRDLWRTHCRELKDRLDIFLEKCKEHHDLGPG